MSLNRSRCGRYLAGSVVLIAVVAFAAWVFLSPSDAAVLEKARQAFRKGRFLEAQTSCDRILARDGRSSVALLLAAKSAIRQQNLDAALKYFGDLPPTEASEVAAAWYEAGELALQLGRASQAERSFRQSIATDGHLRANVRLAYLLGVEGRCWEAVPFLMASVRRRDFTIHHLVLLGASEPVIADLDLIERCRQAVPSDPRPLIGLARNALQQNDPARAEEILRSVISAVPDSIEAHATLGRALVSARPEAIRAWESKLPRLAEDHPDIWSVRGLWAEQEGRPNEAIRCFWEAIRRDPNHRVANFHVSQLLSASHQPDMAKPFADRADRLREYVLLVDRLYAQPDELPLYRKASELTESLGRLWEAWAWSHLALLRSPLSDWARDSSERLDSLLDEDLPQTIVAANPANQIDLTGFPIPQSSAGETDPPPLQSALDSACEVKYSDIAASCGVAFTYVSRLKSDVEGTRMLETTGGGVAVLDFDLNGYPDLHFTQGGDWSAIQDQSEHRDVLYRNFGDGHFERAPAGIEDRRYGQGVAAGDFDNDGFPDLYVANIGRNRLYRNNGDGTFTDISDAAGIQGALWTTSCLIADLNGDGLPDLYDVNYLSAKSAATQICRHGAEIRWCSPDAFDAEQDQVYFNSGDGHFENVTTSSGIAVPNGKGLGIVAADFDESGKLSLFIANDAVANFFFVNQSKHRGDPLQFEERAVLSGLAFDRDGLPQACMGVAAGDANDDGRIDLFVTNFSDQSNTLYQQSAGLMFEDVTRRAGLRDPSYAMLGFGTQFLDGELDGKLDLVLTNGHVFDLSYKGVAFQMPPQYYQNVGGGRFKEVPAASLGPYFQKKYQGRGLARLDWNRDGREDFVVSHINSPASVVENQTPGVGHYLSLQFRGVNCSRDAIGTIVHLVTRERTWTQQLMAGDGYQASNERRVVFGLGKASRVDELHVHWPSGVKQIFRDLAVDCELLLIENQPQLYAMNTR